MSIWKDLRVDNGVAWALGGVLVIYMTIGKYIMSSKRLPLPPGPSGLPWVGNVIGINTSAPWVTYSAWAKTYGEIVYSRIMGKEIIIINSEEVARALLEQRSRNYSDRPIFVTNELCGIDFNTGLMPYGDTWRLHRRFFHHTFNNEAILRFRSLQYRKGCQLLHQLLETPAQFSDHVFNYMASLILNSVYNYDPTSRQDEISDVMAKVLEVVVPALRPDTALIVGAFPAILYLPSWLPGMSFIKEMKNAKKVVKQYVDRPFEFSKQRLSDDGFTPSMVHDALYQAGTEVSMQELRSTAATAFIAGAETSTSVLLSFFLMMTLNPRVQAKAQAQIDHVVGEGRLPTADDRASLPYVDAILRELYRYHPVFPLCPARSLTDDDTYSGYHIPKGAIVLVNLWSIAHDESHYPKPYEFNPERHLDSDDALLPDSTECLGFGFGRRICPGRYFASASLWSALASILAVFNISKAKDEHGVEIPVEPKYVGGVSVRPLPFACAILPRTPGMDKHGLEQLCSVTTM